MEGSETRDYKRWGSGRDHSISLWADHESRLDKHRNMPRPTPGTDKRCWDREHESLRIATVVQFNHRVNKIVTLKGYLQGTLLRTDKARALELFYGFANLTKQLKRIHSLDDKGQYDDKTAWQRDRNTTFMKAGVYIPSSNKDTWPEVTWVGSSLEMRQYTEDEIHPTAPTQARRLPSKNLFTKENKDGRADKTREGA